MTSVNVPIFKSGKQLKCCSRVKQVGHVCDCFAPNVVWKKGNVVAFVNIGVINLGLHTLNVKLTW